jgi:2-oxoglutarate dehydrogenase E2 component (dihydrolipoamide succinyltransferase)
MGESIVDARVARWFKKAGEAVNVGDPLVELETDKVDVEVAAPQAGVLEAIAHGDGDDVKIGDVLGTIAPGSGATSASPGAGAAPGASASGAGATGSAPSAGAGAAATPSARKLAREKDVALDSVKSDGPRVRKTDVAKAVAPSTQAPGTSAPSTKAPSTPAPSTPAPRTENRETRERMSKRRATIARRLVEVQQTAAMLTTFNEVDMSAVMALRERHKQTFKDKHGVSLGIASFFVKAAVIALGEFPRLNAEIQGDEIVLKHYYDIGVAVGAVEGLVVPVLRAADRMSFAAIELGIRAFATKAGDGSLSLEDIRGGTFTITNGGVFGSLMSTPILNPPQVGILGLHTIKERPVGVGGQVVLRPMMYTALTYDHRIVDGAEAVQFLVRVKDLIEDPAMLLIES